MRLLEEGLHSGVQHGSKEEGYLNTFGGISRLGEFDLVFFLDLILFDE